jgi:hypothetical protein
MGEVLLVWEPDVAHCASGRQDHTTSPSAVAPFVRSAISVHRIPRSASVTIASRPSVRRDGDGYRVDLGRAGTGIFFAIELDRANQIEIVKQFAVLGHKSARQVGRERPLWCALRTPVRTSRQVRKVLLFRTRLFGECPLCAPQADVPSESVLDPSRRC